MGNIDSLWSFICNNNHVLIIHDSWSTSMNAWKLLYCNCVFVELVHKLDTFFQLLIYRWSKICDLIHPYRYLWLTVHLTTSNCSQYNLWSLILLPASPVWQYSTDQPQNSELSDRASAGMCLQKMLLQPVSVLDIQWNIMSCSFLLLSIFKINK